LIREDGSESTSKAPERQERDTGLEPATFALARRVHDVPWCYFLFIINILADPPPSGLFLRNSNISHNTSLRTILSLYTGIVAGIVHSGQECVFEALR
jgi:hypothetical protein